MIRATVLVLSAVLFASGLNPAWPNIVAASGSQVFSKPLEARFDLTVANLDGKPEYELSCRSGELEDTEGFNFSGLFHCRLVASHSKSALPSLLLEDENATADWEGRARFLLSDVVGSCGKTPEWGAMRAFKLRGMRIELSIRDIRLSGSPSDPDVGAFTFSYSVSPDPSSTTSIAEKAKSSEPKWFSGGDDSCLKEVLAEP